MSEFWPEQKKTKNILFWHLKINEFQFLCIFQHLQIQNIFQRCIGRTFQFNKTWGIIKIHYLGMHKVMII